MNNYFISKDKKSGEVVYLEYNKDGYKVSPKARKKDEIKVNKIVFVSPDLTQKLLKKKIDSKVSKLLLELNTDYDDDSSNGGKRLRDRLKEAERLKLVILNNYSKYLGKAYTSLTIKKMQIIIDGYREKLYRINVRKEKELFMRLFNSINEEPEKKGKGR